MNNIIYTYNNQVYANITNRCNCRCTFCIRNNMEGVGTANSLWLESEPTLEEIKEAMDRFDFRPYSELIYCGFGEPTCALENLVDSARYVKEHNHISVRLNTNGLGNLYYNKNIVPLLGEVVDTISISLNAPDSARYNEVTRPFHSEAFAYLLKFASECKEYIPTVKLTVVDVLSAEDIEASRLIADSIGIPLRIRKYSA